MQTEVILPQLHDNVIVLGDSPAVTPSMLAKLTSSYPGLQPTHEDEAGRPVVVFDTAKIDADSASHLYLDLTFFAGNTNTPLENLCNHFDTYLPANESQTELLAWAKRLVALDDTQTAAGLLITGANGVGKTHIAISAAKALILLGQYPAFAKGTDNRSLSTNAIEIAKSRIWIIDDVPGPYGFAMESLVSIALHLHDYGGRMLVTSNHNFPEMFETYFRLKPELKPRFLDRSKQMFWMLGVNGESHRQREPWFQDP